MNHLYLTALLYLAAVLQMGQVFDLGGAIASPAWIWLALVAAVRHVEGPALLAWGAIIGLAADCVSSGPLGLQLICGVIFAGWLARASHEFARPRPLFVGLLLGIVTFLGATIVLAWTLLISGAPNVSTDQLKSFYAPALSTAVAAFTIDLLRTAGKQLTRIVLRVPPPSYSTR